jgi:hypothetical protein
MTPTTPICQGIIFANGKWRDPSTGSLTLLGLLGSIRPNRYPFTMQTLVVLHILTGGRGRVPVNVRIVEVLGEGEEVLAVNNTEIDFAEPLAVLETVVTFQNTTFPHPGMYQVQVRCGNVVLMERRLFLNAVPKPVGGEA